MGVADNLQRQAVAHIGYARDVVDELVMTYRFVAKLETEELLGRRHRRIVFDVGSKHVGIRIPDVCLRGDRARTNKHHQAGHGSKPYSHQLFSSQILSGDSVYLFVSR